MQFTTDIYIFRIQCDDISYTSYLINFIIYQLTKKTVILEDKYFLDGNIKNIKCIFTSKFMFYAYCLDLFYKYII